MEYNYELLEANARRSQSFDSAGEKVLQRIAMMYFSKSATTFEILCKSFQTNL